MMVIHVTNNWDIGSTRKSISMFLKLSVNFVYVLCDQVGQNGCATKKIKVIQRLGRF